jgi:hypothetical protein
MWSDGDTVNHSDGDTVNHSDGDAVNHNEGDTVNHSDGDTVNHNCILVIRTAPWRWPDYQPKHVGENTMNKMHHRNERVFVGYLCIFGSD